MFGISLPELLLIFVLILVVLGPEKLPEVARWVGKGLREVRKASNLMRDALMLDDDEGYKKRQALPRSPSTTKPTLIETPDMKEEIPRPDPRLTTAPPPRAMADSVSLDQAGGDFDRAFDSHFNAPYSELIEVPLHPGTHEAGVPRSLFEVSLKPSVESQSLVYVPFRNQTEELAQW